MERYVCIHGHFYQPPRENPWLETIELQDSAYPYHDWNARISAECYAPNAASRILDSKGRITQIVNNYGWISFNVGPTLLAWLEWAQPEVYAAIIAADRLSAERFGGHGSAMAQNYNHMIMPLASRRDKRTQICWGIRDFRQRFGRDPEGMWLAESAVDLETLDLLAEQGIRFTVLAPRQASRFRPLASKEWQDVSAGQIDPTRAYLQRLPSGRQIALFFYDGPISQGVAFEGLLDRGENLANRLLGAFSAGRDWPQLVHIATDGETYGHHHRYGEMALSYALHYIETNHLARITNYGEYLALHPPTHEVDILENTSWSCAHGVERWRRHCGCNSGGYPSWNQHWRTPLRETLNWLRDELASHFEREAGRLLRDPWAAREHYIDVVLDRGQADAWLDRHASHPLSADERLIALRLLEVQRHAMLMFTSCGWFFDELSGIETVQVIHYAGRAVQLAELLGLRGIEEHLLQRLERVRSNMPEHGHGRAIYEKWVRPTMIDLPRVGAHYAISSLFETYPEIARIYAFTVERRQYLRWDAGRTKLAVGQLRVASEITQEDTVLTFGVLHFGDHNLSGGVRVFQSDTAFEELRAEAAAAFERADMPEAIRVLDRHFGELTYSIRSLFHDEQRRLLDQLLANTLDEAAAVYSTLYERHAPLMRFMTDLHIPLPRGFKTAAEFALNTALRAALEADPLDRARVAAIMDEARHTGVALDQSAIGIVLDGRIERLISRLAADPADLALLTQAETLTNLARTFSGNFWQVQNRFYLLLQSSYPGFVARAAAGDAAAQAWVERFEALGADLGMLVDRTSLALPDEPPAGLAAPAEQPPQAAPATSEVTS